MEASYLNGKVIKRTLPEFELPLGVETPTVKRLRLPQGELAQFYDGETGMRYLAAIELLAGTIRGNHYHEIKEEWLYVIHGEVLLVVEEIATKAREALVLGTGDLALISTRIAHALQVRTSGQAIEFSSARFDPIDIHRVTLI